LFKSITIVCAVGTFTSNSILYIVLYGTITVERVIEKAAPQVLDETGEVTV